MLSRPWTTDCPVEILLDRHYVPRGIRVAGHDLPRVGSVQVDYHPGHSPTVTVVLIPSRVTELLPENP